MHITTTSESQTKELGTKLSAALASGAIVCLYGELGAGKTTFVKGIAAGLGITEEITSPTFTLMNVYPIQKIKNQENNYAHSRLVHIDTYRLKSAQELIDIGVEDYLGQPGTITIIEWPEKIESLLSGKKILHVTIEHGNEDERTLQIED